MRYRGRQGSLLLCLLLASSLHGWELDESPGKPEEWGFRPAPGATLQASPPAFSWRPQKGAVSYTLQVLRSEQVVYEREGLNFNVHTPPEVLSAGDYLWRFRALRAGEDVSAWSTARAFSIAELAVAVPLPEREELLARIPRSHPRLFVRPEQMDELRRRAAGDLAPGYEQLVSECEQLLADPPATTEPPKYDADMVRGSDPWRAVWWGNRRATIRALDGAAVLAFTWQLGGNEAYAEAARSILMACAAWDPRGATGYRYNDEAGMPYNYYFSRSYTFLHDFLSEEERTLCREVMQIRGEEMYRHLCPRHFWKPYSSHSNRAWHFLGELGIAFLGELDGAEDWVWFAANVFANVYPVWTDGDGGWHEGSAYWQSYLNRFTWWADIMRSAMDVDAYARPFFARTGDYALYMMPPGTRGGGFGDQTARRSSKSNAQLMAVFANQAQNPCWQWYVEAVGGAPAGGGYVGFVRAAREKVEASPPTGLPTSKLFAGVGQAYLNTTLLDAGENVEVLFKSSPFGTRSHGYEAQNAFLLYAWGERLFIRSGRRDSYGSKHHREWMWQTKSVNSVTVDGEGQIPHSAAARGEIVAFHTSPQIDYVAGEAGCAYGDRLDRFTRRILFIKPELVLIFDTLAAPRPSSFEWWLHTPVPMAVAGQADIEVVNNAAACRVSFLWPADLQLTQTDAFDPPPRPRVQLVEHHLTASTSQPAARMHFVTALQPHRAGESPAGSPEIEALDGGFAVRVPLAGGELRVLLQDDAGPEIAGMGVTTRAAVEAFVLDAQGHQVDGFASSE